MSDPGPGQPAYTRSQLVGLLRKASSYFVRAGAKGVEYDHLRQELERTADAVSRSEKIGPPPPGITLRQWGEMSRPMRQHLINQHVMFAEFNAGRADRLCAKCQAMFGPSLDALDGPRRPLGVDPEAWDAADERERKRLIREARG